MVNTEKSWVCYFGCHHIVGSYFVEMVHRDVSNLKQVQMG